MKGTPQETKTRKVNKGEVFKFLPSDLNPDSHGYVAGVMVQVQGNDFRYAHNTTPKKSGFIGKKNQVLRLTKKEAHTIRIVAENPSPPLIICYNVYNT